MMKARKQSPSLLKEELASVREMNANTKALLERYVSIAVGSGPLDSYSPLGRAIDSCIKIERLMQVGEVRLHLFESRKTSKKPKPCKAGKHKWIHVGTRMDSPLRCGKCPMWYADCEESRGR